MIDGLCQEPFFSFFPPAKEVGVSFSLVNHYGKKTELFFPFFFRLRGMALSPPFSLGRGESDFPLLFFFFFLSEKSQVFPEAAVLLEFRFLFPFSPSSLPRFPEKEKTPCPLSSLLLPLGKKTNQTASSKNLSPI